ncbi:MAG: hypothetical protein H5U10_06610 [Desulfacinum sp.]|jgi:hypothetical protein|nr:hypothetical protein [Desulfacinum sp.]MBZ4660581.1 hypothetical protein [Desulfacinum sp.]
MSRSAKSLGGLLLVVVFGALILGCATTSETGTSGFAVKKLTIPETVSTKSPYPAVMHCVGLEKVDILQGHFFWNGEGPYAYEPTRVDPQSGEVVFMLHTGRPGTYRITGYVSFWDKATSKVGKTKPVSAGVVLAR